MRRGCSSDASDESVRFYQKYDVLFRLFPLVPSAVRTRLRAEHVPDFAPSLAITMIFFADALAALVHGDRDGWAYGKHYLHHMRKSLPRILAKVHRPTA